MRAHFIIYLLVIISHISLFNCDSKPWLNPWCYSSSLLFPLSAFVSFFVVVLCDFPFFIKLWSHIFPIIKDKSKAKQKLKNPSKTPLPVVPFILHSPDKCLLHIYYELNSVISAEALGVQEKDSFSSSVLEIWKGGRCR